MFGTKTNLLKPSKSLNSEFGARIGDAYTSPQQSMWYSTIVHFTIGILTLVCGLTPKKLDDTSKNKSVKRFVILWPETESSKSRKQHRIDNAPKHQLLEPQGSVAKEEFPKGHPCPTSRLDTICPLNKVVTGVMDLRPKVPSIP